MQNPKIAKLRTTLMDMVDMGIFPAHGIKDPLLENKLNQWPWVGMAKQV